jgi:hypothetical protein
MMSVGKNIILVIVYMMVAITFTAVQADETSYKAPQFNLPSNKQPGYQHKNADWKSDLEYRVEDQLPADRYIASEEDEESEKEDQSEEDEADRSPSSTINNNIERSDQELRRLKPWRVKQ